MELSDLKKKEILYVYLIIRIILLLTYKNWYNEYPSIKDLVNSGFYYAGKEDRVICFYCGLGLWEWGKTDNVNDEHLKYSSKCIFMKNIIKK